MIEVRRLGPQIGAEITGVDVKTLDDAGFAAIYRAWLDYNVVVVPGQDLEIDDFLRYSRRFGHVRPASVEEHAPSGLSRDHPARRQQVRRRRHSSTWRSTGAAPRDGTPTAPTTQEPFKATQLYALAIPSRGGDTLFASMYAAYDALPQRLKRAPRGADRRLRYGGRRKATALLNAEDRDKTPVLHPIVRTHPETGRKALYFDPGKILRIEGLDEDGERRADRGAHRLHDPARRPSTATSGARATS